MMLYHNCILYNTIPTVTGVHVNPFCDGCVSLVDKT